jgi:hypothetical protein
VTSNTLWRYRQKIIKSVLNVSTYIITSIIASPIGLSLQGSCWRAIRVKKSPFSYGKIQKIMIYVEWSDTVMFKFFVQNVHISQWNICFYYHIKFSTFYMTTNILQSYYFICLSLMLVCRHNGFRTITFFLVLYSWHLKKSVIIVVCL